MVYLALVIFYFLLDSQWTFPKRLGMSITFFQGLMLLPLHITESIVCRLPVLLS